MRRPRNVRHNLHAWRTIVLPRVKVYMGVLILHALTRDRRP